MHKHHPAYLSVGFTLIEVLIVVAILAVLSAIAFPLYTDHIQRGKIPEALGELSNRRIIMENYFMDNRKYDGGCGLASMTAPTKHFTYTCTPVAGSSSATPPTPAGYLLTATGISSEGMANFAYTLDQSSNKVTTDLPANWKGKGSTCWVIKKTGDCG